MRIYILVLVGLVGSFGAKAQKYSNEFLSIGVGARAQALGTAVVAGVDDVMAGVWNPAGLAAAPHLDGMQIAAMHSEWFGGVGRFDYLAATLPMSNENRRLAISAIRFGIDKIPNTLSLYGADGTVNFDNLKEFSAADYAFILSYAQRGSATKPSNFTYGGNIKVIYRRIGSFANSWGFGIDGGVQYRKGNLRLGLMAKDITTSFNAWSFNFTEADKATLQLTNNSVPINSIEITKPQLILGIGYRFQYRKIGFSPEINFIATTDGKRNTLVSSAPFSLDPAAGLEMDYNRVLFFRLGVNQFQRETNFGGQNVLSPRPSLGIGFKISALQIDYAFTDLASDNSAYSHIISLQLNLKKKKTGL